MRIQFISDLHEKFPYIIPQADYIALIGDVANPFDERYFIYLSYLSQLFKGVFVIFGNHEYYYNIMPVVERHMENICRQFNNVYFLNNKSILIDGYLIVGSTLWSAVEQNAYNALNCGNLIKMNKHKYMDFMDYRVLHLQCVEFIKKEIEKGYPTIILTHYAPIHEMNGNRQTRLKSAFSSDLTSILKKNVKAWLSVHTHTCIIVLKEGVLFSSNCLGHLTESCQFNVNKCIEI